MNVPLKPAVCCSFFKKQERFIKIFFTLILGSFISSLVFSQSNLPTEPGSPPKADTERSVDVWFFQTHVRHSFRAELIKLVLSYTDHMSPALRLRPWTQPLTQQRAVSIIRSGRFAMFATLSEHRQFRLKELVRNDTPLVAGLMGFRLLLAREDRLSKLAGVQSLEQLREQIRFGFGQHWRDFSILESNGLQLVGTPHYGNLFPMLEAGRFDAIPRGLNEALSEEHYWQNRFPDIRSFSDYALYYPYPVYLYMHVDHQWIVERINYGIFKALEDGKMRRLFELHFAKEIQWLRSNQPKMFMLDNSFLEQHQVDNLCWWAPENLLNELTTQIKSVCR